MSVGTSALKVSGEGPEVIQAPQESLWQPGKWEPPQQQPRTGAITLKLVQWKYLPNPILTSEVK